VFVLAVLLVASGAAALNMDALAPAPSVSAPTPKARFPLRRTASGELVYDGRQFSARIATDGTVAFRDHWVSDFTLLPPWLPMRGKVGPTPSLQEILMSRLQHQSPERDKPPEQPPESKLIIPLMTPYRPDPREGCRECELRVRALPLNAGGNLDLSDELLLFSGQDPHRFEKAQFLAETREVRIHLAVNAHASRVRAALANLPGVLEAIASDEHLTPREQRAIIEALRNELDTETLEGRAAREQIAHFLATRFQLNQNISR
jgi:hypothetical protein